MKCNAHLSLLVTLIFGVCGYTYGSKQFHGAQVLRLNATTKKQLGILGKMYEKDNRLDFWTWPSILQGTDIMITMDHLDSFKNMLESEQIPFTVMIPDVEKIVAQQRKEAQKGTIRTETEASINWNEYQTFETISRWMDTLVLDYPSMAQVEVIGKSTEGRPMKLIKISSLESGTSDKKSAIWIDGGIHAREWISTAVVTYFINQLLTKSEDYEDILSKVDFYILPVVNPDGYAYTWSGDRMWRKTRSNYSFDSRGCLGVDPNRNFGYKYGLSGTSSDECSEIYKGPTAFSEPETRAIRDYILSSPADFNAFITIHSYSQAWVYPWGYASELPLDWAELDTLAKAGTEAIRKKHGTEYLTGSSTNVLYAAAGGSDDWAKGDANIKYCYTIELRDTGTYGFLLPSSEIMATAEETWDGIQVVAHHIASA